MRPRATSFPTIRRPTSGSTRASAPRTKSPQARAQRTPSRNRRVVRVLEGSLSPAAIVREEGGCSAFLAFRGQDDDGDGTRRPLLVFDVAVLVVLVDDLP